MDYGLYTIGAVGLFVAKIVVTFASMIGVGVGLFSVIGRSAVVVVVLVIRIALPLLSLGLSFSSADLSVFLSFFDFGLDVKRVARACVCVHLMFGEIRPTSAEVCDET